LSQIGEYYEPQNATCFKNHCFDYRSSGFFQQWYFHIPHPRRTKMKKIILFVTGVIALSLFVFLKTGATIPQSIFFGLAIEILGATVIFCLRHLRQ